MGVGDFSSGGTDSFGRPLPEPAVCLILKVCTSCKSCPSPTALVFLNVKSTSPALLELQHGFCEFFGNVTVSEIFS